MQAQKKQLFKFLKKYRFVLLGILLAFGVWWFCLPQQLFTAPTSTVVKSKEGLFLGGRIARDGQWRFPETSHVPKRFAKCLLYFEDEYFYQHPGFNPVAIAKAFWQNITTNKRRGGSTITQQVIRLSRKNQNRTYLEKGIELVQATRLEVAFSKKEILNLYASYAPFGGNVVGLETAAWRYFGIPAKDLSWGQAAALAVLPNAPALIFPGKNEAILRKKRNRLLHKLHANQVIDKISLELALQEPLPQKPLALPDLAPHLTEKIRKEHRGKQITTSLSYNLQKELQQLAKKHYLQLKQNKIHNLAVVVLDIKTRKVVGYIGNAPNTQKDPFVDIIQQPRSTGSILKPFLYAAALDAGQFLPHSLIEDVPTNINGYAPLNYDKKYRGATPAGEALAMSLNVPFVRILQDYGVAKFYNLLQKLKLKDINRSANSYGLSLILGGAESSLWDITNAFATMAGSLNFYVENSSQYRSNEFLKAHYIKNTTTNFGKKIALPSVFSAGSIYHTLKSLQNVNRPEEERNWEFFSSNQAIAWKTGTSYGFKDAWAVGVTPKYAVGVWAGNADGEGRPGLTGVQAAAPLLFDVFKKLPFGGNFQVPHDDLEQATICNKSGDLAGIYCENTTKELIPIRGKQTQTCGYHQQIILDTEENFRVNASCYSLENMRFKNWFVLPPIMAHYYAEEHPGYKEIPSFKDGCSREDSAVMQFIYPKKNTSIILPKNFKEESNPLVLKLIHRSPQTRVYWYLDNTYLGSTQNFHEKYLSPASGLRRLTVIDEAGNKIQQRIRIEREK
ncbi:penicillin-binding protein 1C [Haloflavibacter putidus]|uniref:penicillin-binding protein 1C n=1 Tax=Haloflavibacter putidus TaxID=2576776 RepID=UPI001F30F9B0|nr:penicillin-binding protein 1C [Haloflavibacter putidus]